MLKVELSGPVQALCVECYLDPDQPPVHHVDNLPPKEVVQGLHQVKYRGSEGSPTLLRSYKGRNESGKI